VQATHEIQHLKRGVDYMSRLDWIAKCNGTSWEVIRDVLG